MPVDTPKSLRPASRWMVIATAAAIVVVLSALLPLMNPALELRAVASVGWFPALLTAHIGWAIRVGAIRRRFSSWGFGDEPRDNGFSIAVINPRILTVEERSSAFWSYVVLESGVALLAWIMVAGPAFGPLVEALGR